MGIRIIQRLLPFLGWFKDMRAATVRVDVLAGVTVALVLVPQSMAYAQLAGLPAYYGLYASLLPPMVAALFGSSRQLATGPVAVVSLLTAATLEPLATAGSEAYIAYAVVLAVVVGLFQLGLGLLRLGVVVNFLSHPVVNGFTNAAALIIASSQLATLFGVTVDGAEHHYETIYRVAVAAIHYTHLPTLALAALAFAIMYGLKKLNPRIPFVLFAVVTTTVIAWATGFEHNAKAPIAAIQPEEVRAEIAAFNASVASIEALSERRAQAGRALLHAEETLASSSPERLERLHQKNLIDLQLANEKSRSHQLRERLRYYHFSNVPAGKKMVLYVKGAAPQAGDGRIWRLKVGNTTLDPAAIPLMGGGAVVGRVPGGLPSFALPQFDLKLLLQFFTAAAIISLLGFMEAISIAKSMAAKTGQRLDPNQELIGQGLANIVGALSHGYPVSGSFSRSAVNLGAGAKSGLSSVCTSVTVAAALLFMTPLLYHIPQSVLAAVIMMAVVGLINVKGFVHTYRAQKYDGVIALIAFLCTLVFAPHLDRGILVGLVLSIGHYLYRNSRPGLAFLSLHPDFSLRDVFRHGLKQCQHVAVLRFEGPLFFANTSYLEDQVNDCVQKLPELRHLLITANSINEMDASGEEALSLMIDAIRERGIGISFSGVNENVLDLMKRTHLFEKIGAKHIYPTMMIAVKSIHGKAHIGSTEAHCPLLEVSYADPHMFEVGKPTLRAFQVVVLDRDEKAARAISSELERAGIDVRLCTPTEWPPGAISLRPPDVVVIGTERESDDPAELYQKVRGSCPGSEVLLLGGDENSATWFKLAKMGVYGHLPQKNNSAELVRLINRAVYEARARHGGHPAQSDRSALELPSPDHRRSS